MKEMIRAIRMYFRISIFWALPLIILAELLGILIVAALALGLTYTGERYDQMMFTITLFTYSHLFVVSFFLMGALRSAEYKFFSSTRSARQFSVAVPVISALMLSLPLDMILLVYGAFTRPAEALIINALNTVITCFFTASLNKSGLQVAGMVLFIPFVAQLRLWSAEMFRDGFGISVLTAAIITVLIYVGGTALNLFIMDQWWKRSGRKLTGKEGAKADIAGLKRLFHFLDA